MPLSPSVADELVAHGHALRRLAKDLVGRSDADDLVQDTAVRALRSPPAEPEGLFSWLATVMRRLAANRGRGDRRRERREGANAPRDDEPAAGDTAAQRDQVRAVIDALWSLPEPYQGTLVMRYFQELSPAQIARRTGTPLATVKSRLQRGLDLLRTTLARRDGRDWRAALVPAFGLATPAPWLLSSLSVASMTTLGKSAAAAVVCGVLALAWWQWAPASLPDVAPAPVVEANGERAHVAAVAEQPKSPAVEPRAAAAVDVDAIASLAQPFAYELRARVVDADGLRMLGAQVAIAPVGCALATAPAASDEDGWLTVAWRARVPAMTIAVGLEQGGTRTALQELRVAAGTTAEVHFVGGNAPLPSQVRLDALGRQIVTMPDCAQGKSDCRACHEGMAGQNVFEVRGALRPGLHPDARFGDRLAVAPPDPSEVSGGSLVSVEGPGHFGIKLPAPRIEGRVFAADGKPAVGVGVWGYRPGVGGGRALSMADGTFRIGWWGTDGPLLLHAGGGPEGRATQTIELRGSEPVHVDLFLATGRTLRGRAIGANGAALNGARVEFVSAAGGDGDLATVGPDGQFAFANLPPGAARLLLWGVRGEKLPIAELRDVPPDGGEVAFDLRERPARGELRVFVRGHDGEPAKDLEVRAWQQDTGRGAFLDRREDGAFHLHGMPAGFYRVEVGSLASGFVDLGPQWVDGIGMADLGTVQLPQPGRVRIEAAAKVDQLELYARRADVDMRADEIAPWSRDVLLPAGRWVALWKRGDVVHVRELALVAGGEASLRLDP